MNEINDAVWEKISSIWEKQGSLEKADIIIFYDLKI